MGGVVIQLKPSQNIWCSQPWIYVPQRQVKELQIWSAVTMNEKLCNLHAEEFAFLILLRGHSFPHTNHFNGHLWFGQARPTMFAWMLDGAQGKKTGQVWCHGSPKLEYVHISWLSQAHMFVLWEAVHISEIIFLRGCDKPKNDVFYIKLWRNH